MTLDNKHSPAIGLVLGAGGTPGGFFIRAGLAALTKRTGWKPAMSQSVVGTSVGALNAARIDATPLKSTGAVGDALADLAQQLPAPELSILDRIVTPIRRTGGRAAGRFVPAGNHEPTYDVADPPFHPGVRVVSCRRSDGTRRITFLSRAENPEAELYASAAIPGWAPPVSLDGVDHVDGAVWSTTNADLVSPVDHDILIVIAPMVPRSGGKLLSLGHRALLVDELAVWQEAEKPVIYLVPSADALANKEDHTSYGSDASSQVLQ